MSQDGTFDPVAPTAAREDGGVSEYEALQRDECRTLLGRERWGRVAVQVGDHPEVFPVNYVLDGERIVFRTDRGTKLASIRRNHIAAFQIDAVDEKARTGWSVMAVGPVTEVHDLEEIARLEELELENWVVGEHVHWMRLSPHHYSGRRLG